MGLHLVHVVGAGLGPGPVAVQHTWINPQLTGHEPYCRWRSGGHVVGAEPQHPQPTQLQRPAQAVLVAVAATDLGQVGPAQREEPVQGLGFELRGEPRHCSRWASDRNRTGIRRLYDGRYGAARPTVALISSPLMLLPDAGDVRGWLGWLADRGTDVLDAGRVTWSVVGRPGPRPDAASVRRQLSALSSFYRYCAAHDPVDRIPTAGVARPVVDPDYTATVGLDRDQVRALVAAADADRGPQALRTAAVIRLLVHNALRVDEACAADVADLGADAGHRVLRVTRKGARRAKVPLAPATVAALDAYLTDWARRGGLSDARQLAGPLLATASGGRLRQGHLCDLVRRLARDAGIQAWDQLSRTACGTRRSPSRSTPAPPSAMSRTMPGTRTPHDPPVRPRPGQPGPQRRLRGRGLPRLTGTHSWGPPWPGRYVHGLEPDPSRASRPEPARPSTPRSVKANPSPVIEGRGPGKRRRLRRRAKATGAKDNASRPSLPRPNTRAWHQQQPDHRGRSLYGLRDCHWSGDTCLTGTPL